MARFLLVFALVLSFFSVIFGEAITVKLGDSATLHFGEKCTNGEVTWVHPQRDDKARLVAVLHQGVLKPAEGYENRITPLTGRNLSLVLNRTTSNDQGYYEYTCGNSDLIIVFLEILIFFKESFEGQNATLMCHSVITDDPIRWEKDGQLVYERDCASGNVSYGTGFEGRASTSPAACKEGDLSLTLTGAQQADRGVYRCYHGKDNEKGNPAAVKLNVRPPVVKTTVNPPTVKPTANNGEGEMCTLTALIIAGLVAAFAAALIWVPLGWCLKSKCSRNAPPGTGGAGSHQIPGDVEMLGSERQPLNHPAVNGGPPAQMIIDEEL